MASQKHFGFDFHASRAKIIHLKGLHMSLNADVVVVGSGPAGLATAIMLARNGFKSIKLFDKLAEPATPDDPSIWGKFDATRTYNIGVSGRGRRTLADLGALKVVKENSAVLTTAISWFRKTPLNIPLIRALNSTNYPTICLERDRLSACLLQTVRDEYADSISFQFETRCTDVIFHKENCSVQLGRGGSADTEEQLQ